MAVAAQFLFHHWLLALCPIYPIARWDWLRSLPLLVEFSVNCFEFSQHLLSGHHRLIHGVLRQLCRAEVALHARIDLLERPFLLGLRLRAAIRQLLFHDWLLGGVSILPD